NLAWDSCRKFVRGAQMALDSVGWGCDVLNGGGRFEETLRLMRQLVEHPKATDGAILLAWHTPTFFEVAFNIRKAGIPVVIADYAARELQVPGVISDNYRGGQLLGEHLLEMGHKRIAFIGDTFATTVASRLEGLRDALAEGGVPLPKSMVFDLLPNQSESSWAHDINYAMNQIWSRQRRPTAIACSCDAVARGIYDFAREHGISIPRSLSVTGFDDDPLATRLTPELTSIRQSFEEMGSRAAELLKRQSDLPEASIETVIVPVTPALRKSVQNLKENHP
ncbi:MAG: substrate-binding domain-containing protein, partial [Kiritimatiellia bacterium]